MTKADKLFKELGYKKTEDDYKIYYESKADQATGYISFVFDKKCKNINIDTFISMPKLKAIIKKCEELGWLDNFIKEFQMFFSHKHKDYFTDIGKDLREFLMKPVTPTLTEDERVILRNIDKAYRYIHREYGNLRVSLEDKGLESESFDMYDNLFQFIKERRRIRNC